MTTDAAVMERPTSMRLRHARGLEISEPVVNQAQVRRAYRITPAVETMHKVGKISDRERSAYDRFEADWNTAGAGPSVIAKYGERAGGGGTPIAHLAASAFRPIEDRDERRSKAVESVEDALAAVCVPSLCKALVLSVGNECGLEVIGRSISAYTDRGKAIAVAGEAIRAALCLLDQHYSRLHGQSQIAP